MRTAPLLLLLLLTASCGRETFVEPHTKMRFVLVPAGTFTMGSTVRPDEVPHRVRISRPFFIGETEVTQREWVAVMGANPSAYKAADAPVERVTWLDVQEFLRRLNARGGGPFRLPTEAEWEYACRAGNTSEYNTGARLDKADANYDGEHPLPVRSFDPNAWGLYDMHGNVWEWCADEYCPYPRSDAVDPFNRCNSPYKVIRGGSWYFGADSARSALRYTHEPQLRGFSIGFRVVRER